MLFKDLTIIRRKTEKRCSWRAELKNRKAQLTPLYNKS